jgi:hypothetical protein
MLGEREFASSGFIPYRTAWIFLSLSLAKCIDKDNFWRYSGCALRQSIHRLKGVERGETLAASSFPSMEQN